MLANNAVIKREKVVLMYLESLPEEQKLRDLIFSRYGYGRFTVQYMERRGGKPFPVKKIVILDEFNTKGLPPAVVEKEELMDTKQLSEFLFNRLSGDLEKLSVKISGIEAMVGEILNILTTEQETEATGTGSLSEIEEAIKAQILGNPELQKNLAGDEQIKNAIMNQFLSGKK